MLFVDRSGESLLYGYFHEFHNQLKGIRQELVGKDWARIISETPFPESLPFRADLLGLMQRQAIDAGERGGEHGGMLYRKLKYLMVALADEFFLHLVSWEGREIWREHLLELEVFNTQSAGQQFFSQIDELLVSRDPVALELARIYLLMLALGFQGRYRDTDDKGELNEYRRRLYHFITRRQPQEAEITLRYDEKLRVCPAAYESTLGNIPFDPRNQWLPSLAPWYWAFAVLILGGLLMSMVLWYDLSRDLSQRAIALANNSWVEKRQDVLYSPPKPAVPFTSEVLQQEIKARELAEQRAVDAEQQMADLRRQLEELNTALNAEPAKPDLTQYTLDDMSFSSGQATLSAQAQAQLAQLADLLKPYPDSQVEVKGYTDSRGSAELNLRLSLRRANAVRDALIAQGIAAEQVTALGYGEGNPLADNATPEGRSRNRRVEIEIRQARPAAGSSR